MITHWGRATHICVGNLTTIVSDIGLEKMRLKVSFAKWRPFCLGLNVIKEHLLTQHSLLTSCDHVDLSPWWHHQMENFPRYWPFVWGINRSPVNSRTKASDTELWCFLWSAPEWRLSKRSWGWWCETPLHPLWRHSNENGKGTNSLPYPMLTQTRE